MKNYTYVVSNDARFHGEVLTFSIFPRERGVAYHLVGRRVNLSIGLNQSFII